MRVQQLTITKKEKITIDVVERVDLFGGDDDSMFSVIIGVYLGHLEVFGLYKKADGFETRGAVKRFPLEDIGSAQKYSRQLVAKAKEVGWKGAEGDGGTEDSDGRGAISQ